MPGSIQRALGKVGIGPERRKKPALNETPKGNLPPEQGTPAPKLPTPPTSQRGARRPSKQRQSIAQVEDVKAAAQAKRERRKRRRLEKGY